MPTEYNGEYGRRLQEIAKTFPHDPEFMRLMKTGGSEVAEPSSCTGFHREVFDPKNPMIFPEAIVRYIAQRDTELKVSDLLMADIPPAITTQLTTGEYCESAGLTINGLMSIAPVRQCMEQYLQGTTYLKSRIKK